MAEKRGRVLTSEMVSKMMGRKAIEAMKLYRKELRLRESAKSLLAERDAEMERIFRSKLKAMPGLKKIINRFYGNVPLAIATGNERRFVDLALKRLDLQDRFSVIVDGSQVSKGKPHPDIYRRAVSRLQISPDRCIVLEDSHNGCMAALNAGCITIAVPSTETQHQDFSMVKYRVHNLLEARELIGKTILPEIV